MSNTPHFLGQPPKRTSNITSVVIVCVIALTAAIGWYTAADKKEEPTSNSQPKNVLDGTTFLAAIKQKQPQTQELQHIVGGDITVEPPRNNAPKLIGTLPPQEQFTAKAMLVKDHETGAVLYKKNEYTKRPIASISKLMSALVLLEGYIDWNQSATVIPDQLLDNHMYAGESYTMEELWQAALIASSNKAIFTLADNIGWPREAFVERMNQKALELGMIDTTFVEPTGLNSQNVSTASDIVLLLNESLKLEKIKTALLTPELTIQATGKEPHRLRNTNWLLLDWIPHRVHQINGGKTGFINASGYNFTIQVENEAGNVIDVVVLGTHVHEARFTEARDIAQAVFENYSWDKKAKQKEAYVEEATN